MGRFDKLFFKDFAELAKDDNLSKYNKIGFDDEYRKGFEGFIFDDIQKYLPQLAVKNSKVLDIGPGCSDLPHMLMNLCKLKRHDLTLVDSLEMLNLLPDTWFTTKIAGVFPDCLKEHDLVDFDAIIVYSVLHHVFFEMNPFTFIDRAVELLADGGSLFIGDIPNSSKKVRSGIHGCSLDISKDVMEDGFIFSILQRYRNMGFETYLVPHNPALPLKNTRDNILISRQ